MYLVLVWLLAGSASALICYDKVKCYGRGKYSLQYLICENTLLSQCSYGYSWRDRNKPNCGADSGGYTPCSPDWFHKVCTCTELESGMKLSGSERCTCTIDKTAVGIVGALGGVAAVFAVLFAVFCVKWRRTKKVARVAEIQMETINRALGEEGLAERLAAQSPIQRSTEVAAGSEEKRGPPPEYQEMDNIYSTAGEDNETLEM